MYTFIECLTCGQKLGHLRQIYLDLVLEFSKAVTDEGPSPEFMALEVLAAQYDFDPNSYCCRRTMICQYDATDLITGTN
jgi:DNA-directed RNA polymerase subunit N (RpoN/RPB10)